MLKEIGSKGLLGFLLQILHILIRKCKVVGHLFLRGQCIRELSSEFPRACHAVQRVGVLRPRELAAQA